MTANVIDLRPRLPQRPPARPRPVPARPRPVPTHPTPSRRRKIVPAWPVVEWDPTRDAWAGRCEHCTETVTFALLGDADAWADTHRCDAELVALLTDLTGGTAA